MNRTEHLLDIAAEEAVELAQRLIKAARFGLDQVQPKRHDDGKTDTSANPEMLTNRERCINEYNHLVAAMAMLDMDKRDDQKINAKIEKVETFLDVARSYGTLDDEKFNPGEALERAIDGTPVGGWDVTGYRQAQSSQEWTSGAQQKRIDGQPRCLFMMNGQQCTEIRHHDASMNSTPHRFMQPPYGA